MYILNDNTQNYPFCRLKLVVETFEQLNELTNQNSLKFPKLLRQRIRKRYIKTFGTSVKTDHCPLAYSFAQKQVTFTKY